MSTWRQKAIDCAPELRRDFEQPSITIYSIFHELLPLVVEAHQTNDNERLNKIYAFAEWCFKQKEKDLWNAAGVSFYEHLGDHEETRRDLSKWVKPDIYREIRGLLELRVSKEELSKLDKDYR